jgi:hypothetical protein
MFEISDGKNRSGYARREQNHMEQAPRPPLRHAIPGQQRTDQRNKYQQIKDE